VYRDPAHATWWRRRAHHRRLVWFRGIVSVRRHQEASAPNSYNQRA
jgi:hypothetical protein